jgi:hypothetical protein
MDLAEVQCLWISPGQIAVPNKWPVVRVALDALTRGKNDGWLQRLAEPMFGPDSNGDDRSSEDT